MKTSTKEEIYDAYINPLMAQIIDLCKAHQIPFIAAFQLANEQEDENGEYFCTSGLFPEGCSENLTKARDAVLGIQSLPTFSMTIQKND